MSATAGQCHAGGDGAHGACNIFGKCNNARGFDPRSRLKLIKSDDWAWMNMNDFTLNAEITNNLFDPACSLLKNIFCENGPLAFGRFSQQFNTREFVT